MSSPLVAAGLYIQPCLATSAAYRLGHAVAQLITNTEAEQAGPRGDPVSSEPMRPLLKPSFPAANAGRTGRTILPVAEEKNGGHGHPCEWPLGHEGRSDGLAREKLPPLPDF